MAPSASTDISQKLADSQYKNWLLAGQGLLLVKDGIKDFCSDIIKTFHTDLQKKHTSNQCTNESCFSNNIEFKNKGWNLACPVNICDKWLQDIVYEHKNKTGKDRVYWQNSSVKDWPISHWDERVTCQLC